MAAKKQLRNIISWSFLFICWTAGRPSLAQQALENIPHGEKHGTATQLFVQHKPFMILGGELGNSSASNMD